MSIDVKYQVTDHVFIKKEAQIGNLVEARVVSLRTRQEEGASRVDYQIYSPGGYYNKWYPEEELSTQDEAEDLAKAYLEAERARLLAGIDELTP